MSNDPTTNSSLPVLSAISREPYDISSIPTAIREKGPDGKPGLAVCELSLDVECDGVNSDIDGSDLVSLGLYGKGQVEEGGEWVTIVSYEVSVNHIDGTPLDPQNPVNPFWKDKETNLPNEGWERICTGQRDRKEVAQELISLVAELKSRGWTPHVLARPAPFDFGKLSGFFKTMGFQNPFGFGGASQVTDIGQRVMQIQETFGCKVTRFNDVMKNVIGRDCLAHGGLQDSIDQWDTWHAVRTLHEDAKTELQQNINSQTIVRTATEGVKRMFGYQTTDAIHRLRKVLGAE